jgi:hypothetical protein
MTQMPGCSPSPRGRGRRLSQQWQSPLVLLLPLEVEGMRCTSSSFPPATTALLPPTSLTPSLWLIQACSASSLTLALALQQGAHRPHRRSGLKRQGSPLQPLPTCFTQVCRTWRPRLKRSWRLCEPTGPVAAAQAAWMALLVRP